MTRGTSLTSSEKIVIKGAHANNAEFELHAHGLTVVKKTSDEVKTVQVEIQLEKSSTLNSISFINKSGATSISAFYLVDDDENWAKIPILNKDLDGDTTRLQTPLITTRAVQVVFYKSGTESLKQLEVTHLTFAQRADFSLNASSQFDRLWVVENLIDGRPDYGWASAPGAENEEWFQVDLGSAYFLNQVRLKSVQDAENQFPDKFSILVSINQLNWQTVATEDNFFVSSNSWYSWIFNPVRAQFIKVIIENPAKKPKSFKVLEFDTSAVAENKMVDYSKSEAVAYASELMPGAVILSENHGSAPNRAVQASDTRLRPATTESIGLVQLAKDSQASEGLVVQSNDSRLKTANENSAGIVQLAKDGEGRAGAVVQGHDMRLKPASTENAGIARLAKDRETRPESVVQGNDSRLREATVESAGIIKLAKNGEAEANAVVQSDDKRLRSASTTWSGIVQLAELDEEAAMKALQANDPRLKKGSETEYGRVIFARNKEAVSLRAVQADDSRLSPATEDKEGIVRFARSGAKVDNAAVQASDSRLEDAREPLPHEHDYAKPQHDLNSHTGPLNVEINKSVQDLKGFSVPDLNNFSLSSKNNEGWAAGFNGGLVSQGNKNSAIKGVASDHNAVQGYSRNQPAGMFISEKDFALILPGKHEGVQSSDKSLMAQGKAVFKGEVNFKGSLSFELEWDKVSSEAFAEGDLLTVNADGVIEKLKNINQACIGIYTNQSRITLKKENPSGKKRLTLSIAGAVNIRVTGPVVGGRYIGFAGANPGVAKELPQSSGQNAVAIALESSNSQGEKLVKCLLRR